MMIIEKNKTKKGEPQTERLDDFLDYYPGWIRFVGLDASSGFKPFR